MQEPVVGIRAFLGFLFSSIAARACPLVGPSPLEAHVREG